MSVAAQLLSQVEARGVEFRKVGGRLKFKPRSKLTTDLKEELRRHRAEILEFCDRCDRCKQVESGGGTVLLCPECEWTHPKVRVQLALEKGPMTANQVATKTGLSIEHAYHELGGLFDLGLVGTEDGGNFYLIERY